MNALRRAPVAGSATEADITPRRAASLSPAPGKRSAAAGRSAVGVAAAVLLFTAPSMAYAVVPPPIATPVAHTEPVRAITADASSAWTASVRARSDPVRAATGPFRPVAMPRSYRLKLHEQYQLTNYYCVPASSSMSLSTFGVKVSQAVLAKLMKTTTKGTGGNNAAQVMDGYLHPRRFDDRIVGDVVGHPDVLMERVSYDVGALRRAPVVQVWMEKLPWNKGRLKGQWIGHAIIAFGYNKAAGTITVFDPWRPTGGAHTLSVKILAAILQNGAGMHYISRL